MHENQCIFLDVPLLHYTDRLEAILKFFYTDHLQVDRSNWENHFWMLTTSIPALRSHLLYKNNKFLFCVDKIKLCIYNKC